MNESSVVCYGAIGAYEGVGGNGLTESFDSKGVHNDFFSFFGDIWMDEGDVVIGGNDVAKGRETFFQFLDGYVVREGVSDVFEFGVGDGVGDEEAVFVAYAEAAYYSCVGDGGADDRDAVCWGRGGEKRERRRKRKREKERRERKKEKEKRKRKEKKKNLATQIQAS